jgi:hypothetical protein
MKKVGLFVFCFFLSFALGCSQGGDDEKTIPIFSTDQLDGYILRYESGGTTVAVDTQNAIRVGDWTSNDQMRGFVSFDLSPIPQGSTIKSAQLRVYQTDDINGDPYRDLGMVVVDHVFIGGTLDASDYDGGLITSGIGTLSFDDEEGWKPVDVTEEVRRDFSEGRDDSQ